MHRILRTICILAVSCLTASTDLAAPASALVPVDQAVSDIDPLARGMRQMETGLRPDGEQTSLYTPAQRGLADQQQVYYRVGPGFVARVPRMNYAVPVTYMGKGRYKYAYNITPVVDGHFIEIAPIGVVYELSADRPSFRPEDMTTVGDANRPTPDLPPPPRVTRDVSRQVGARVDSRIDGRVGGQVDGRATASDGR